ncbi:MAG: hypothetical protein HYV25_02655 [Candidatus Harrisonbacteria bacterium]|nr:hypothetical protein [Candidatus Harrisonbacteria bacterium]
MSEKFLWETPDSKKIISNGDVVEALKNTSVENPDTQQLALWWAESKEAELDKYGGGNARLEAQVDFEIERAEVYLSGGCGQESFDAFQDALTMADGGGRADLAEKIQARIEEIDNA